MEKDSIGRLAEMVAGAVRIAIVGLLALPAPVAAQDSGAMRGEQSIVIISLKTPTGKASHCSNSSLASSFFTDVGSVSAYYSENSYGLLKITGTVVGPYVVTMGKYWSPRSVADDADAAVKAAGVDLSAYSRRVYIVPREADSDPIASSWGGIYAIGSRVWIRDFWCSSRWLAAHELAHSFAIASAVDPPAGDDYSTAMYAFIDPRSDPSTWNYMPHFNAPEKIAEGWIPASAVESVSSNGTFDVASVETIPAQGQLQALKIKGANGGTDYYFFSYRQAVGFSSELKSQFVARTSVIRWNGRAQSPTYLLANLADGQVFSDSSGLTVTQSSHDLTHARITVSFAATRP